MVKNKKFVVYEEPYFGRKFTRKQLKMEYKKTADKREYPTFKCWLFDNIKVGNIIVLSEIIHGK